MLKINNMTEALKNTVNYLKLHDFIAPTRQLHSMQELLVALNQDAGTNYMDFDAECITDSQSYSDILNGLKRTFENDNRFEIVSSHYDVSSQTACIKICVNSVEFSGEWHQKGDWIAEEFWNVFDRVKEVLNGEIVNLPIDQNFRAFYFQDKSSARDLAGLIDSLLIEETW